MNRRCKKLLVTAIVGALGCFVLSVPADAARRCKSAPVAVGALTEGQAIAAWRRQVRRRFGAPWSDLDLARNKQFTQQTLPAATMHFVSAIPCRRS